MSSSRRFRLQTFFRRGTGQAIPSDLSHVSSDHDSIPCHHLVLHPEGDELRRTIANLRTRLSELFQERLGLEHDLLPRLRDLYTERFGDLERTIQLRTLEMSERRRIVELISLKLDRGQKLDDKAIDLVVRTARAEYGRIRARLHSLPSDARRVPDDLGGRSRLVDADQGEGNANAPEYRRGDEIRHLYRRLARRFHPDAAGDDSGRRRIWDLVQRAKAGRDIELLRTLDQIAFAIGEEHPPDIPTLRREALRLERTVGIEQARIASIHSSELYAMREQLSTETFIEEHRRALSAEITSLEESIGQCDQFLSAALKGKRLPPAREFRDAWSNFVEEMYINRG